SWARTLATRSPTATAKPMSCRTSTSRGRASFQQKARRIRPTRSLHYRCVAPSKWQQAGARWPADPEKEIPIINEDHMKKSHYMLVRQFRSHAWLATQSWDRTSVPALVWLGKIWRLLNLTVFGFT